MCRSTTRVDVVPEGDTVWLSAERMRVALAGRTLTRCDFRVPALATVDLTGRRVLDVVSRGKHMLTRFDGGLTLHTHFRMEGSWRLFPVGRRWQGGPNHEIRAVLGNERWVAVGYRLPVVDLLRTADEDTVVGHLGPDLLGQDWDANEAMRRLRERPERSIGEALLDQRNLAGIGNLYKAEVLFLRGIHPWTPVRDVPDLAALIELGRRLLVANKDRWDQVTTGDLRRGRQLYVYGRGGEPCRRCRTRIARADQGDDALTERVTFWCPSCQPAPSGWQPPARAIRSVAGRAQRPVEGQTTDISRNASWASIAKAAVAPATRPPRNGDTGQPESGP
jgi:endonuclease-8